MRDYFSYPNNNFGRAGLNVVQPKPSIPDVARVMMQYLEGSSRGILTYKEYIKDIDYYLRDKASVGHLVAKITSNNKRTYEDLLVIRELIFSSIHKCVIDLPYYDRNKISYYTSVEALICPPREQSKRRFGITRRSHGDSLAVHAFIVSMLTVSTRVKNKSDAVFKYLLAVRQPSAKREPPKYF